MWRKTIERNRERLVKKIRVMFRQIDDIITQENTHKKNEAVELTPSIQKAMSRKLRHPIEQMPEPSTK